MPFVIIETYMPQLFMYVHVIQRVPVLMIATLCSYLSGSCTNGIKMLDGFTKLCSNYKNGVLLASQKVFRWTPLVTNNAQVVNLRAMQTVRKTIWYGWALSSLVYPDPLPIAAREKGLVD